MLSWQKGAAEQLKNACNLSATSHSELSTLKELVTKLNYTSQSL